MRITPEQIIYASWILFGVYWFVSAFSAKKTEKREPSAERLGHMILMAVGYILLFQRTDNWGVLNHRFLPHAPWIAWLGNAIAFAIMLFGFYRKARKEDAFLAAKLGESFQEWLHCQPQSEAEKEGIECRQFDVPGTYP